MLFTAIFLFVSFDILCIKLNISGRVFCFYIELEFFICCLIFIPFLYDKEKYQKEMKKNLLPLLLKNMFNIETGSNIPVEYVNDISYIKDINSRHIVKVEKKLRNNSFHGEYNGIKFQMEEAYIYFYDSNSKSRKLSLLFFFELNKPSDIVEINTKESYTYEKAIWGYFIFFVLAVIFIILSNLQFIGEYIFEENPFITTLIDFVRLIYGLDSGTLLCFILLIPFAYFVKPSKKTEIGTKDKRVNPQFLNLLNELSDIYDANSVNCRLFNDSLTIVVNTRKDLFEIGDVKPPINQSQSIQAFYRELNIIFKIIDYLVENNEDITM